MKCNYKRTLKNTPKNKLTEEELKLATFYKNMYSKLLERYYDEKNKTLQNEEEIQKKLFIINDPREHLWLRRKIWTLQY